MTSWRGSPRPPEEAARRPTCPRIAAALPLREIGTPLCASHPRPGDIPVHIRERAGLLPHIEVEFAPEDGVVTIRPAAAGRPDPGGDALIARMRGRGDVRMTIDEIMKLMRGE